MSPKIPSPAATSSDGAYADCLALAASHYENFPVASRLLPPELRKPVSAIYAFARTADDIADEGDASPAQRLAALHQHGQKLERALAGETDMESLFIAAADTIHRHRLDAQLFHDLLTAFSMDINTRRYANFDALLHYCRYSANPVGRLLIQLAGKDNTINRQYSDAICTALQLINFQQDLEQDLLENDRIYLAGDEMQAAGITEQDLHRRDINPALHAFMQQQYLRADRMLLSGYPLIDILGGRLGLELRITLLGAHRVARKLMQQRDIYSRPRLGKLDWLMIGLQGLFKHQPLVDA
ncbi:squalene synthase HpnC [Sulfuriflexus mobilis]|uniref:squalene synthase HpnC n=1 Tax=Sulfuriflexus mobilis TaxID=1811807 RepID=UPI000F84B712|nr:squalene synthase HpnC [Sulfuriflexus mobilis]